ncbi:MAG TPA: V-type ATP synthase subunit I [Thermoanaerobacterales bacterium]|nr:V-type ATP synthase subunit I [Thermoanaerobacterales bacterium]
MAIVEVKKMSILALQDDKDEIMRLLQEMGSTEIINLREVVPADEWEEIFEGEAKTKERDTLERDLAELNFALGFVSDYDKTKKPMFADKPVFKEEELANFAKDEAIWEIVKKCRTLDGTLNKIRSEEMKLQNTISTLEPWEELKIPMEDLGTSQKVVLLAGTLPTNGFEELIDGMKMTVDNCSVEVISSDRETTYVLIIFHKDVESHVMEILKSNGWSRADLPDLDGTPVDAIQEIENKLERLESQRNEVTEDAEDLVKYRDKLELLLDYYEMLKVRKDAYMTTGKTEQSFYMEAWIPEPNLDECLKTLNEKVEGVSISITDPEDEDDVPIVLDNPKIVEPYEMITELYSLPDRNKDIDPNLFMAPFFFIFFGMMVSDAGYGIFLALVSLLAIKVIKPVGMAKKLFDLIFLGGISTLIWGAIFGGWFGGLIPLPPIWINPIDDPISLLIFSFILGLIQIYTGLILKAYINIKEGDALSALFDQGFWMILLAGCIMFALPATAGIAKTVVIIGAIGLVLTQGRHQDNIIQKFLSGLLSLYDITGYLSDVLSYSRVLALGLATGVIGTVINTMAELVGVNIVGYVAMTLILVIGHVFNIAINALGAYVHSSRLQYVEFFSKFYEGGGRAFNPFRISTRYINLENGEEI